MILHAAGPTRTSTSTLLSARNVAKSYAGVRALRDASFELRAGEVHALIGENGAGKSTFIKILTGAVQPDSGELVLDGTAFENNSPSHAKALGIAAIYQQPALFPELTVAENIALGVEQGSRWGRVNWGERRRRAKALLQRVGARIDPDIDAGVLSMPEQQLVEIARALGADARVLILDEPTASLAEADAQNLLRVIRELKATGVGMIYISHRLEELPAIADRVTVLRDGTTIGTRDMHDVSRDQLIAMMVGRELSAVFPKRAVALGKTVLELRGFGCSASGVRDIDLTVRAGEIVGIAGLMGAGRTELARALFGLTPGDSGSMVLNGKRVHMSTPAHAIAQGLAYVPEDRRHHGVVLEMPVGTNITLASLDIFAAARPLAALDVRREKSAAADYTERLGVKTPSIFTPVSQLSGGNQQKVALARWLMTRPSLLILDEPTQGIDVGAKSEIHGLMSDLAAEGVAILMISSELPEILGMSDRIAVMYQGTITAVLTPEVATPELILAHALGHQDAPAVATRA